MFKIGNVEVSELKEKYGTPLYIYDENIIKQNINDYKEGFVSKNYNTQIIYASKAFSSLYMYKLVREENIGVDVVSGGELYGVIKEKVDPKNIFFHGNNKGEAEMDMALSYKVKNIIIDNLDELKIWAKKCERIDYDLNLMLRINVGVSAHTHEYIVTAHPDSKFGYYIENDDILESIELIEASKNMKFKGFHFHVGSQIFDMTGFTIAIEKLFGLIKKINRKISYLNLGGGCGVKYTEDDKPLSLIDFSKIIIEKVDSELEKANIKIDKLFIEPGRSLVANAGYQLYTINQMKKALNKTYYFIDGGMNDNIRPALYGALYSVDIANKMDAKKDMEVSIAGKCCESGDVLFKDVKLPKADKDDLLIVYTTGAYGYSMASNYNRLPRPAVVFVDGNNSKLVIKRETYEDLYKNDLD
ncbi:MAG: diaminopimelate decarboxylase [Acholeplasmatales bacterium]|nr:diaminopimelate decarboxylase [Acholeplasmatales bacterium]